MFNVEVPRNFKIARRVCNHILDKEQKKILYCTFYNSCINLLQKVALLKIWRSHPLTGIAGLPSTIWNGSKNEFLIKFLKGALKFTESFQDVTSMVSAIQEFSNSVLLEFISFSYFYIPSLNKDQNKYKKVLCGIFHSGSCLFEMSVENLSVMGKVRQGNDRRGTVLEPAHEGRLCKLEKVEVQKQYLEKPHIVQFLFDKRNYLLTHIVFCL